MAEMVAFLLTVAAAAGFLSEFQTPMRFAESPLPMKKPFRFFLNVFCVLAALLPAIAQTPEGPFPPTQWPASVDPTKTIHYMSVGDAIAPPAETWQNTLTILNGGDQTTAPILIGGFNGVKATGNYINVADTEYPEWADDEEIDILMQIYGDSSVLSASGEPRNFNFLIGTLPELDFPVGGQIPVEGKNQQWNWVLFRIPNTERPSDGTRRVGSVPEGAQGSVAAGGVNGGTIRMEAVRNLIVRAVAFGPRGAFGEPEQVNKFAASEQCAPEPETNLAFLNLANEQNNHMILLNNGDQTVTIDSNIGPANDKRRAARPNGEFMNFAVTNNYLGLPCHEARTVKICVEYYDDPALAGARFGPEAFATDSQGGVDFVPEAQRHTLTGSGRWERRSWTIPNVNLTGTNVAPNTGGPRLIFENNAQIYISQFNLGVFRTGTNSLAGIDPLADCFSDPNFCSGTYGNYAELDLAKGVTDGLAPGNSGGDQEMIQEEAGPATDRRQAIRPARDDGNPGFAHQYLNFAITDEKLGPTSQPGVRLAICVTYYDDPALAGATFRPEVYISDRGGTEGFAFTPGNIAVALEGTDKWRDAYFEITDVKFNGVNQGPQAAARFTVSDKVFVSRVRYGVIRPCGPDANVNPLEECKPILVSLSARRNADGTIRISWPAPSTGFVLQENTDLANAAGWTPVTTPTPTVENNENVVNLTATGTKFFRLVAP